MEIHGVCPIAPAVFHADGSLDYNGFERCCARMIELGAQGLALFGIAGEYYKLEPEEEERLIDLVVRVCHSHRVPAVISNTKHSTAAARRRAARIEASGADCMMVLPPFFLKPAGAELLDHLDAVAASVTMPLMLQYAPEQTGVAIAPEALAALGKRHGNLRYFKIECRPPGTYVSRLRSLLPPQCGILVGNAGFQMIEGFRRGAIGVMPGPSMPDLYRRIWDALLAGEDDEAQRLHDSLNALLNHIRQNVEMIIHYEKHILQRRGLIECAHCRPPGFHPDAVYDHLFEELFRNLAMELKSP